MAAILIDFLSSDLKHGVGAARKLDVRIWSHGDCLLVRRFWAFVERDFEGWDL